MNVKLLYLIALIFMLSLTQACAPMLVKPLYSAPDYDTRGMESITILPVFDARKEKSASLDADQVLKSSAKRVLKGARKYEVEFAQDYVVDTEEEDIVKADPEWVKKLGPEEARFVMVVMLEDLQSKLTFGSTGSSEVSGWIFDKRDGTTIWKHKGIGKVGQGGLIGMAMKATMATSAFSASIHSLFRAIPPKGEGMPTGAKPSNTEEAKTKEAEEI